MDVINSTPASVRISRSSDIDEGHCFITTSDGACGTNPRRICLADHDCPDSNHDYVNVTDAHYDERTGRLYG